MMKKAPVDLFRWKVTVDYYMCVQTFGVGAGGQDKVLQSGPMQFDFEHLQCSQRSPFEHLLSGKWCQRTVGACEYHTNWAVIAERRNRMARCAATFSLVAVNTDGRVDRERQEQNHSDAG